jgi:hypothetical protein
MRKFLVGWFGRSQNRGGKVRSSGQRNLTLGGTRAEEFEHPNETGEVKL